MQLKHPYYPGIKAFTLIEIIIVVVIIGMMSLFAIPSYTKTVQKTYEKTGKNELLILYGAQKQIVSGGGSTVACTTPGVTDCNAKLGITLINNGFNYSCSLPGGATAFVCTGAYAAGAWSIKLKDSDNTVCCVGTDCLSLPQCTW